LFKFTPQYPFYHQREHFYFGIGAGCIGGKSIVLTGICWCIGVNNAGNPYAVPYGGHIMKVFPTLEGIIGYEWKSKCFLQLELV